MLYLLLVIDWLIRIGIYFIGWALRTLAGGPIGGKMLSGIYWLGRKPYELIFERFAFARRWHEATERWREEHIEMPKRQRLAEREMRLQTHVSRESDHAEDDDVVQDKTTPTTHNSATTRKRFFLWSAIVAGAYSILQKLR